MLQCFAKSRIKEDNKKIKCFKAIAMFIENVNKKLNKIILITTIIIIYIKQQNLVLDF